jgi:hypothetical protein
VGAALQTASGAFGLGNLSTSASLFRNTANTLQCLAWLIDVSQNVSVYFEQFVLEPADKVVIFDGPHPNNRVLQEFTYLTLPRQQLVFPKKVMVELQWSGSSSSKTTQLSAVYYAGQCSSDSTRRLDAISGSFTDGSDADSSTTPLDCRWLIQPTFNASLELPSNIILLSFDRLETKYRGCCSEYIRIDIYAGPNTSSPVIFSQFTSISGPVQIDTNSSVILIRYRSTVANPTISTKGFSVKYCIKGTMAGNCEPPTVQAVDMTRRNASMMWTVVPFQLFVLTVPLQQLQQDYPLWLSIKLTGESGSGPMQIDQTIPDIVSGSLIVHQLTNEFVLAQTLGAFLSSNITLTLDRQRTSSGRIVNITASWLESGKHTRNSHYLLYVVCCVIFFRRYA